MDELEITALIPPATPSAVRRGWRCPDEARLAGFVVGRLAGATRGKVERHLADCAFCRGQVGFLARAAALGPPPAVPGHLLAAARGERVLLLGHLRPATVVALAAGLALGLLFVMPRGTEMSPGFAPEGRSDLVAPADREVRNGAISTGAPFLVSPAEGASLPLSALDLRWEETPEAFSYTVQIVSPQGDVVWEGRTENAHLAVPGEAGLEPGQPYFAWVLAHLRSGATARSPAVGFRVAPG